MPASEIVTPGDPIICGGEYTRVIAVVTHLPGGHAASPIRNDLPAREFVTARGSRWSGIKPDGSLYMTTL